MNKHKITRSKRVKKKWGKNLNVLSSKYHRLVLSYGNSKSNFKHNYKATEKSLKYSVYVLITL